MQSLGVLEAAGTWRSLSRAYIEIVGQEIESEAVNHERRLLSDCLNKLLLLVCELHAVAVPDSERICAKLVPIHLNIKFEIFSGLIMH